MRPSAKRLTASLGAAIAATVAIGTLAGCAGSHHDGRVTVTPALSLFDQPVHIAAHGVPPDSKITITLRSVDANERDFTSSAVFRSTGSGTVDLASARALDGSYRGVNPMGLIESMRPSAGQPAPYFWPGSSQPQSFDVTVTDAGSRVAAGQFYRSGECGRRRRD